MHIASLLSCVSFFTLLLLSALHRRTTLGTFLDLKSTDIPTPSYSTLVSSVDLLEDSLLQVIKNWARHFQQGRVQLLEGSHIRRQPGSTTKVTKEDAHAFGIATLHQPDAPNEIRCTLLRLLARTHPA